MKSKRSGGILITLVLLALIIYALVSLLTLQSRRRDAESERQALQQQVTEQRNENNALEYDIEHRDDPETLIEIARSKLGLVLPGEEIFYAAGG